GATACMADGATSTNRAPAVPTRTRDARRTPGAAVLSLDPSRSYLSFTPHHEPTAETHPSGADVVDAGGTPGVDRPVDVVVAVVRRDARPEELPGGEPTRSAGAAVHG